MNLNSTAAVLEPSADPCEQVDHIERRIRDEIERLLVVRMAVPIENAEYPVELAGGVVICLDRMLHNAHWIVAVRLRNGDIRGIEPEGAAEPFQILRFGLFAFAYDQGDVVLRPGRRRSPKGAGRPRSAARHQSLSSPMKGSAP